MPTILGVNCAREFCWGGEPEALEKQGPKHFGEKVRHEFRREIRRHFS